MGELFRPPPHRREPDLLTHEMLRSHVHPRRYNHSSQRGSKRASETHWQSPTTVYFDLLIPHAWFLLLWSPRFDGLNKASCKHGPPWNLEQAKVYYQNKVDEINLRCHFHRFVHASFTSIKANELMMEASFASVEQLPTMEKHRREILPRTNDSARNGRANATV